MGNTTRVFAAAASLIGALAWAGAVETRRAGGGAVDDATLRRNVEGRLSGRPLLDVASVVAEVENGVLVLSGTVATLHDRDEVERLASAVRGLSSIENRLRVAPAGLGDATLAAEAERAITSYPRLRGFRLSVTVVEGRCILEGEVPLARDRETAEDAVSGVRGIVAVENRLRLTPVSVDPAQVRRRLERLLKNKLLFGGAEELKVEVSASGEVHLEGVVATHGDRLRAERLAYGIPGVVTVRNDLRVRRFTGSGNP